MNALPGADVVVIDEIEPMGLYSPSFVDALRLALRYPKPLIETIHRGVSLYLLRRSRAINILKSYRLRLRTVT